MAKSKRKSGGPLRGKFKLKKMGKGYNAPRRVSVVALPIDRKAEDVTKASEKQASDKAQGR